MTSVKPYFIQALHRWVLDNGLTPLIVVDAGYPGVRVPPASVEDGKITLNVSYDATDHLQIDDELITFNARFSGVSQAIIVPLESITAIYARENGKGMMFDVEDQASDVPESETNGDAEPPKKGPHLKLVD